MVDPRVATEMGDAIRDEIAKRHRHWIAGLPTPGELDAVFGHVAHRLRRPLDEVREVGGALRLKVLR